MSDIRVLVVDDSAVTRAMISDRIAAAAGLSVAGTASSGADALAAVDATRPAVITLDLQMPGMDGLAVLDAILARSPLPVIMVSAVTRAGAAATLDALDHGAADYVAKPEGGANSRWIFGGELIRKIRAAARMDIARMIAERGPRKAPARDEPRVPTGVKPAAGVRPADVGGRCVAIGISTGGPPALTALLRALRPPMPPLVIVQHMPPQFTGPLAARLDALSGLTVREAVHGELLRANSVFIAPGGRHLELRGTAERCTVALRDGAPVSGHKPSADVMMTSAAAVFGAGCLGVIMTGMGRDGANGCRAIRAAGGYVLGQDAASSAVYGMNRAAHVEGNVDRQFGLEDAPAAILRQLRPTKEPAAAG